LTFSDFDCSIVSGKRDDAPQLKLADILELGGALQFFSATVRMFVLE